MPNAPHLPVALSYARSLEQSDCPELRLAGERFLADLASGRWDFRPALPEFAIRHIEGTFAHQQGERLDGSPLRGTPFLLMPYHIFCTYNLLGFYVPGTDVRRFVEGLIFMPRKNVKTTFATALMWSLAVASRRSGAKVKAVAGSMKQGMEGFDFLKYNLARNGLLLEQDPANGLRTLDSSLGHSFSGEFAGGYVSWETLAYKPELFDSFNANLCHLDELHVYRNSQPYSRLREAQKAYSNKLLLATSTAGDDGQGFAASHVDYACRVLSGAVTGADADRFFAFVARAPRNEAGEVDYLSPAVHRAANPGYGVTIRPADMLSDALRAEADPRTRKDFLTRSLNIFVNSYKAWFDIEEFQRSDARYSWTQAQLTRLVKAWYGGADLSKLHDLTAAALVGEIPARKAATAGWTPPEDVLVIVPHCWFPLTAAAEKADRDRIPLFGWQDDGWLDMPAEPSMDPREPVRQFKAWRSQGFAIRKVGHDRKFATKYFTEMKKQGFTVVDQPQLYLQKSEGFRYIEHKAKVGCLYYLHAEPYEYCVGNVRAVEKVDDAVQYEKLSETSRIDVFDASVFAVVRMLQDGVKRAAADKWLPVSESDTTQKQKEE